MGNWIVHYWITLVEGNAAVSVCTYKCNTRTLIVIECVRMRGGQCGDVKSVTNDCLQPQVPVCFCSTDSMFTLLVLLTEWKSVSDCGISLPNTSSPEACHE